MHSLWWSRGVPMGRNSENAFPKGMFSPNSTHFKSILKHCYQRKKNWKIMFGWENRDETLIFMPRHFDQTMAILISHFFPFWCAENFYLWSFSDMKKQNNIFKTKKGCFYSFQYLLNHFSHHIFSPFICSGWRANGVLIKLHYQQVNDQWNSA